MAFDYISMEPIEKRLKHNDKEMKRKNQQGREENKMVNDQELSVKHRWINLCQLRGGNQTIVSNQLLVESICLVDALTLTIFITASRKFIATGPSYNRYFAPAQEEALISKPSDLMGSPEEGGQHNKVIVSEDGSSVVNKWGKFKDVDKVMAFLCYDMKVHKGSQKNEKVYTVCYLDRFLGTLETEVWRFHEQMDVPSHRVRLIKCNGDVIWDRKNKFSLI
uniref:MJ1316 RNA cyclic group end recognition domain-containing protein n=1 Tax=Strombidium rassoulzadegani TaxID=1082188 RepID=A0A7S3CVF1_9SPIT|mmetsp:Transcript_8061/g.13538  ORF Transcript_8061/g.13538 Transcript_8061/m.13538 type:complete len:221 (+) Transcript_8061:387-1049(+)